MENRSRALNYLKYLFDSAIEVNEKTDFAVEMSLDGSNYIELRIYRTKDCKEELYSGSYQFMAYDDLLVIDGCAILSGILKTGVFELPKEEA